MDPIHDKIFKEVAKNPYDKKVLNYYREIFTYEKIDELQKEDMDYLNFKNNDHWHAIHRYKNIITEDMPQLRKSLKMLLDKKQPIVERLNNIKDKNSEYYIKGFGRATLTPILLFSCSEKYGIYNAKTEKGLKIIQEHPPFERTDKLGEKYKKINKTLNDLAEKYDLSLWDLDYIWYEKIY